MRTHTRTLALAALYAAAVIGSAAALVLPAASSGDARCVSDSTRTVLLDGTHKAQAVCIRASPPASERHALAPPGSA
jgi:hypothetical protein